MCSYANQRACECLRSIVCAWVSWVWGLAHHRQAENQQHDGPDCGHACRELGLNRNTSHKSVFLHASMAPAGPQQVCRVTRNFFTGDAIPWYASTLTYSRKMQQERQEEQALERTLPDAIRRRYEARRESAQEQQGRDQHPDHGHYLEADTYLESSRKWRES